MDFLTQLWLPILLSAVAVWFWSFLSHAVLPVHAKDFQPLPDEKRFSDAVRPMAIAPGYYSFPHCTHKDMKSPEMQAKWKAGPMGVLHVWSPNFNMARNMIGSFLIYVVIAVFMAYVGNLALPHASTFLQVWQVVGTLGVMAYTFSALPGMLWYQFPGRVAFTHIFDGVVTGLIAGAVFAAMWPVVTVNTMLGH